MCSRIGPLGVLHTCPPIVFYPIDFLSAHTRDTRDDDPSDFPRLLSQAYHGDHGALACASFQKKPSAILVCCIAVLSNFEDQQRYFSWRPPPRSRTLARSCGIQPARAFRVAAWPLLRPAVHADRPDVRPAKKVWLMLPPWLAARPPPRSALYIVSTSWTRSRAATSWQRYIHDTRLTFLSSFRHDAMDASPLRMRAINEHLALLSVMPPTTSLSSFIALSLVCQSTRVRSRRRRSVIGSEQQVQSLCRPVRLDSRNRRIRSFNVPHMHRSSCDCNRWQATHRDGEYIFSSTWDPSRETALSRCLPVFPADFDRGLANIYVLRTSFSIWWKKKRYLWTVVSRNRSLIFL